MGELLFIIVLAWSVYKLKERSAAARRGSSVRSAAKRAEENGQEAAGTDPPIRLKDFLRQEREPGNSPGRTRRSLSERWGEQPVIRDDENDWLSQQLREEQRLLRKTSAMFDLRQSHFSDCDAGRLKSEHAENCNAEGVKNLFRRHRS